MSIFANESNMLILLIGLVLFGLVAAFLFWTRPRPDDHVSRETGSPATLATRSALGDGRSLITVHYGEYEHLLLIGPQSDLLIDSRRISAKNEEKPFKPTVPMPFPPASNLKMMTPRVIPVAQPNFDTVPEPYVPQVPLPQVVVPQPQPAPQPVYHPTPAPPIEPSPVLQSAPVYPPPVYQTPPPAQPLPAVATPANPHPYDNVFQASIHTHQSRTAPTVLHFEPPPLAAPPPPETDITIPAFLQSKINPVMMEQALPPQEALPPHWPESPDHDHPISNWETTLQPVRTQQDIQPQPAPVTDPMLDLAARQLEDALRQKLAEAHQKPQEVSNLGSLHAMPDDQPHAPAMPPPATQTAADAAADRFEQEIRKLLGRDLKKL